MYKRETRKIVRSLLRKISFIGDTYEKHRKNLHYKSFLEIQLELVKRIVATERRISKLKNQRPMDFDKIEEAKERRNLLRLVGTTIAWTLLEFDRTYIRNFARGNDPGFIFGKKGLKLELLALEVAFKSKNRAAILHDLTNCLRVGDLSIIDSKIIRTLELKLTKRKRKLDRRERRQKRRGEIIREFYAKGISTKIIPGWKSIRQTSKKRDKHNWNETSAVIKEALKKGYGVRVIEDCLIYVAFKNILPDEELSRCFKLFKGGYFTFGCHDSHIRGLPDLMPFTCFEIPLTCKEKLLFGEVNFCVFLDINSLCRILEKNGFHCEVLKDSDQGVLKFSKNAKHKVEAMIIGYGLIRRLLYECLSLKTLIDYTKEVQKNPIKGEISTESLE